MTENAEDREAFSEGFVGIQRSELEVMPDAELAQWQSGWKPGTPKHILAEREWDRRLAIRQLQEQFKLDLRLSQAAERANKFTVLMSVAATLVGAFIGAAATIVGAQLQGSQSPSQSPSQVQAASPAEKPKPTTAPAPAASKK